MKKLLDDVGRDRSALTLGRPERRAATTGRTSALTVLSPIRPGWTTLARLVFRVFPLTPLGAGSELQELRFIQSARWCLITDLPRPGAEKPYRPGYDYLFFESNFNGTLESYLLAFADILHDKMRLIWNTSYGFPNLPRDEAVPLWRRFFKPIPGRAFVRYVESASLPAQHFYSAYPSASATEVLAGLEATRQLATLRVARDESSAEEFSRSFVAALLALQGPPPLGRQPKRILANRRGGLFAFTTLSPITPGAEDDLRSTLGRLGEGADSPFAAVAGLHFARWVVIDDLPTHPGQRRDAWPQAYLLTTTTSDGDEAPLAGLYEALGPTRDLVWGHCDGYREGASSSEFAAYLGQCQIEAERFYAGYPEASVDDVIHDHAALVEFARRVTGAAPEQLAAAFDDQFSAVTESPSQEEA